MANLFLGYLQSRITNVETPIFDRDICVNKGQKRFACTSCVDLCDSGALHFKEGERVPYFDKEKCEGCRLCSKFCPKGALTLNEQYKSLLEKSLRADKMLFSCKSNPKVQGGERVSCLAAIPFAVYAYMSTETKIMLDCEFCNECSQNKSRAVTGLTDKLSLFTSYDVSDTSGAFDIAPEEVLSRRDLFKSLKDRATETVNIILPEDGEGDIFKEALKRKLAISGGRHKISTFIFNKNCNGCGHCEMLCPVRAIKIEYVGDSLGKVYHDTVKCTGCDICTKVCSKDAVEQSTVEISGSAIYCLSEIKVNLCKICKLPQPMGHGDICPTCQRKKPKRSIDYASKTRPIV